MTVNLIGSFVFIKLGYGILSSMYHNIHETEPFPETAKCVAYNNPKNYPDDLFDGIYKTVWIERTRIDKTDLKIERQANGSYKLTWHDAKKTYYEGIGFLRTNELIGSYWQ